MAPSCPPTVADRVGDEPWETYPADPATERDLRWPGTAWQVGPLQVRRAAPPTVEAFATRHRWLAERLPVPDLVVLDESWLVTRHRGEPAHHPERQPVPDDVPALVGESLRRLHALDPQDCPFSASWDAQLDLIATAVADDRIAAGSLPAPYDRYEPTELAGLVTAGRPEGEGERPVVCHGAAVVPNLFLDGDRHAEWTGLDRLGVADRHLDLATAHRSIQRLFGSDAVFGFYEGYGRDPDLVSLDHYVLVDVLLAATRPEGPPTQTGSSDDR